MLSSEVRIACVGLVGKSVFLRVPRFHAGEETVHASDMFDEPGGKGFNQAVAAARAGARVSFLGAVGSDGYSLAAQAFLEKENIKPFLVRKQGRTAYAVIITDAEGRNRVTVCPGAELDAADAESFAQEIAGADILLLNNEVPDAVNIFCSDVAKRYGTRIIMNPAPRRSIPETLKKQVFMFTPNEYEAEELEGLHNCVITLGSRGCLIRCTNELIPAEDVTAVDTTGAGDTFTGVLAAMLGKGETLSDAAKTASRAAAITVTRPGAASAIPYGREYLEQ